MCWGPKMRGWWGGIRGWFGMAFLRLFRGRDIGGEDVAVGSWRVADAGCHGLDIELMVQRHGGVVEHFDGGRLDQQFLALVAVHRGEGLLQERIECRVA